MTCTRPLPVRASIWRNFRRKMLAVGKAVKGLRCQLAQAHKHSVIRLSYNVSVLYIQQSLLHSCHFLGSLK
mgnify:CR=1 FL=1